MKRFISHISLLFSVLLLSSCQAVWDMTVSPFVKYNMEESDISWSKYYPECDYLSYDMDSSLRDNFLHDEKYCTYRWRLKYDSPASPIQTIMFDNEGKCVGGYEFCYGNAKIFDVYDHIPIFQRNIYNDTIFKIIKFDNYIDLFDTDFAKKKETSQTLKNYDYNIIVVWSYYGGYYMKRHLRQVKKYIEKFNNKYKFRVIYLRIKEND
ncbi:MAG: hypothetical protein IJZ87_02240 [Bacteroidales bacterium]|nr:hypothetical protein [Bacteroidales bacterium]